MHGASPGSGEESTHQHPKFRWHWGRGGTHPALAPATTSGTTQASHHHPPIRVRAPKGPQRVLWGRHGHGATCPSQQSPSTELIPKGCHGCTRAVPSAVLSCRTSYKSRSSLPLPPNARLLSGSRGRLGIRKRFSEQGYQSGWVPPADARGRGAGPPVLPWTFPVGCSSPAPSASCPVSARSLPHGCCQQRGNTFCFFQARRERCLGMPRLNEKSREQEGGREPGAFKAGEEELKGMKGFDGLLGRSRERCLPPSAGLQARAD